MCEIYVEVESKHRTPQHKSLTVIEFVFRAFYVIIAHDAVCP